MRPLEFPLLADENIHPEVIRMLASAGKRVTSVAVAGLAGKGDAEILRHSHAKGLVVITHDRDFGTLAIRGGIPYVSIIYLRPGHIRPEFVLTMIAAVEAGSLDVTAPFLLVAEHGTTAVRIRVRQGLDS